IRRKTGGGHPDHNRVVAGEHDVDDDHRYERARLVQIYRHARDIGMHPGIVEANRMTISALPRHPGGQARRLGAFYAASFLVVGIQLPFWPVWLAGRGLDAQEIALVFAAAIWAKVIATPLLGALAAPADNQILLLVLVASAVLVAACIGIPPATRRPGIMRSRWAVLGRLATDRRFWLFVASAAALQSSHQLYYGFGTLYWREL